MGVKYSDEELRHASNRVMKSLNRINSKSNKELSKPAIRNSIGQAEGKISKSSKKRHNKKQRANLAGQKMEDLLSSLPEAVVPDPVPQTVTEMKSTRLQTASQKRHHSRKAEHEVARHEIASFTSKSLSDIRAKLIQQNRKD